MSDVRTITARSVAFVDNWDKNKTAMFVYGLEDGTCLKIIVTPGMSALTLVDQSKFVARHFNEQAKSDV